VSGYLEKRMVNEWIFATHPTKTQWIRPRLGQVPNTEMARAYSVTLKFPDAIIIGDGVVYIVEAKMRPDVGAFAQLELYEALFRKTLHFREFWGYPIQKVFLCVELDKNLEQMALEKNIEYVVFAPAWALAYLRQLRRVP
jgi:hypothetical protein